MSFYQQNFKFSVTEKGEARALSAHRAFVSLFQSGQLPALEVATDTKELEAFQEITDKVRNQYETVVILGTGGSSLGGKTLCQLKHPGLGIPSLKPHLIFMDNIDPHSFEMLFSRLDWTKTLFISISKSGSTAETLAQTCMVIDKLKIVVGEENISDHLMIITEEKDSPLERIAKQYKTPLLPHHKKIGGRFSGLSVTGALPALIAGVDMKRVRKGAAAVLQEALASPQASPLVGAGHIFELFQTQGISLCVLIPYLDRLDSFGAWFRQLWAESLGKNGKGLTPIRALGTVDQHSQTQLYLDGPKDKVFTFITADLEKTGVRFQTSDPDLRYLNNRTLGDLMVAEQKATMDTLMEKNCPVRQLHIQDLSEETLGALMMHFMIETIAMAALLEVDAFDQPAVERGKVLTREYLLKMAV